MTTTVTTNRQRQNPRRAEPATPFYKRGIPSDGIAGQARNDDGDGASHEIAGQARNDDGCCSHGVRRAEPDVVRVLL
jgi:hypothetical protein